MSRRNLHIDADKTDRINKWKKPNRKQLLLLVAAGFDEVEAVAEAGSQPVNSPEDWWAMMMGSGYRGTVEQLTPADRERVHLENLDFIQRTSLRSIESNVVYATGMKAGNI